MVPMSAVFLTLGLLASPLQQHVIAPNTAMRVRLVAPLSTDTNRKGDGVKAEVMEPEHLKGAYVAGTVTESKSSGKIKGKSKLNFRFEQLYFNGATYPIRTNIEALYNSQGQANVDEEGYVVKASNNLGKIAAMSAIGALIGGLAGGGKGAAIGAGAGAAAGFILIQVAAKGPRITFASGSQFVITASPL